MSRASAIIRELQSLDGDPYIYVKCTWCGEKVYQLMAGAEADLVDLHGDPAALLFISALFEQVLRPASPKEL